MPRQPGRVAQRRRTRKAIVEATTRLLTAGQSPSVADIAEAADVSRRTVYTHFPTLEHLVLDATLGALSDTDEEPNDAAWADSGDVRARVDGLVRSMLQRSVRTLPLGRRLIRLTVDPPTEPALNAPRRGYRRVEWVEQAVDPIREQLSREQFERLVSALTMVVGWEAMIVLRDVRGLDAADEEAVTAWAARSLIDAMIAEKDEAAQSDDR